MHGSTCIYKQYVNQSQVNKATQYGLPKCQETNQGFLELYDFRACNKLRFSSESICEIPAIGWELYKNVSCHQLNIFCSCERKNKESEKWASF